MITLSVKFSHPVNLELPGASLEDLEQALSNARADLDPTKPAPSDSGGNFGVDDIYVAAFDVEGRQLGVLPLVKTGSTIVADFIDATKPGQNFLVSIHQNFLRNAYDDNFEISKLVFFIPKAISGKTDKNLADGADASVTRGIRKADLGHVIAHFAPEAHQHLNKASKPDGGLVIELVDADQGNPNYYEGTDTTPITSAAVAGSNDTAYNADGSGTPGVVTIDQLRERTGFIEKGPFDIRIILTEDPKGGLTTDLILVDGGAATAITKGASLKGALPQVAAVTVRTADTTATPPVTAITIPAQDARENELTNEMATYYVLNSATPASATGITMIGGTGTNNDAPLPEATGPDNMYHQYFVTITPNPNRTDPVMISVKQFSDNVLPVGNRYVPLTSQQKIATKLSTVAKAVRDMRVANETLSVQVNSAEDAKIAAAKTAYDARQKGATVAGNFDSNPNLKALDKALVIPANGYIVLARGKSDATDILNSDPKIAKKLTAAQKLYNVKWEFSLPEPAANLQNYFRNGGTLQLVYADIPEATGSGHDDAKASKDGDTTHADYTGYVGASSDPIAAGDVIINEIMWGARMSEQYIELHNTTDAPIGIDSKEWAIMVGGGTPPAPFTAIDTVGNNPSTGYWKVPGQVSENVIEQGFITGRTDASSMSRIPESADGTAAASWAASVRRMTKADGTSVGVANLRGTDIGTPGAENAYVMPAAPPPPVKPPPPAPVPAATASDLKITEIMVPSNGGILPQWIEIKNVSGSEVSLNGWEVNIVNDASDTDVITTSLNITLGEVVLDKNQVALVVTKTGRNSGTDVAGVARTKGDANAGMFDADRIVNASVQLKPATRNYSILSESAFAISLVPPSPITSGADSVGNLVGGWELPMSDAKGERSSIIRREMSGATEIKGTDAAGWVLASDTSLLGAYVETYYGDSDDVGTPGYDAVGALPVELSKFTAARDRVTGQVVITWETQSELNNAGFFIKRNEHRTGQFKVVNPTMIPGAGTTSEKQSYTYTDTTAKPNIVYYYQIEDVSLDGNRQTLTRSHRLKGHIGAAGKLTTMWGELKERE